jgi:hypothetical protein
MTTPPIGGNTMTASQGFGERMAGNGTVSSPQCHGCRNYHVGTLNCTAFPNGIPQDILLDRFDHKNPFPGDKGIRWMPKKG